MIETYTENKNLEKEEPQKIKFSWIFAVIIIIIVISFISNSFLKNAEKGIAESFSDQALLSLSDISEKSNILGGYTEGNLDNNSDNLHNSDNFDNLDNLEKAVVKRVVDGDTIVLDDDRRVRYIGINTPETVHPNKDVECYGRESSDKNKELVEGKTVYLESDVKDSDHYGRLLRYVWVDDVMVNKILVKEGFAFSDSYPPDVKYQEEFKEAEGLARDNEVGLWRDCR